MGAKPYLIIRQNYVIQRIMLVHGTDYTYPFPHDLMMLDTVGNVGIGDWYEEAEGVFYRPILPPGQQPTDIPEELQQSLPDGEE